MGLGVRLAGTVSILDQSNDISGPDDTMQEQESNDRLKRWILLDANRWIIVGVLMIILFATIVLLTVVSPNFINTLQTKQSINYAFQGLLSGLIAGVTLVLTINQLVISQELGPIGKQRDRMQGAIDFRQDVEDITPLAISPTEPSTFFRALVEASQRQANVVRDALDDDTDEKAREEIEVYLNDLNENASEVSNQLKGAQFGTFQVLNSALNYDYSRKIHNNRQIQNEYQAALSDAVLTSLNDLLEILKLLGPAREHFKTFYFQWELINLSYAILYVSIPSIIVSFTMILFFDPSFIPGTVLGMNSILLVVCAAVTIGTMPFIVLLAYILRIATVAKRTLAVGPFTLQETSESKEIQWEDN